MEVLPPSYSYLHIEIWVLLMVLTFWDRRFRWAELREKGFFLGTLSLFVLWTTVDQVAVSLDLWEFPFEGSLPIRILRLPIEEYFVFILHSFLSFTLIEILSPCRERRVP